MGLIQREIERVGISTIGISIVRRFSEKMKPPRTMFLEWPFGHPLGEPFKTALQRAVLTAAFDALYTIKTPGEIVDLPMRWEDREILSIQGRTERPTGRQIGKQVKIDEVRGFSD